MVCLCLCHGLQAEVHHAARLEKRGRHQELLLRDVRNLHQADHEPFLRHQQSHQIGFLWEEGAILWKEVFDWMIGPSLARIRDPCCDMYNEQVVLLFCGDAVIFTQLCKKAVPTWSEDTRLESVGNHVSERCLCAGPSCPSVGWSSPSGASSSSPSWGSSSTSTLWPWLRTSTWRRATLAWTDLGQTWTRATSKMPSIAG